MTGTIEDAFHAWWEEHYSMANLAYGAARDAWLASARSQAERIAALEVERDANHNLAVANGERAKEEHARAEAAEAEIAGLRRHIQLHSGDTASLNNDVELMRSHWLEAEERVKAAEARLADALEALQLAVNMVMEHEPGDSRAVSDEAVALASVVGAVANDASWKIIRDALSRLTAAEKKGDGRRAPLGHCGDEFEVHPEPASRKAETQKGENDDA